MTKYYSKKITVDGVKFDSKREYKRWCELLLLQQEGKIANLDRQVKFELIPSQRIDGKVVERPVHYVADFVYVDTMTCKKVVEDSKGFKTKDYIIKRKLMLWVHGLRVREV